ncbi:MAG: CRISPR-associated endonuclease Cas2 [Blastocatellales bacterium]|nr:CRISPR-associated endonuclease Cas2 [Blastocatellales bacterium]
MLIIVAYDIPGNKLRTRLFKTLSRFGEPVQRSVFECLLDHQQFDQLRHAVAGVLADQDQSRNHVRFYTVCEGCRRRILTLGQAFTTQIKRFYIV